MKKLILILSAIAFTVVTSCRQDDESFTSEDYKNLKLIDQATQKVGDSTGLEGDPIPPPKR